MNTEPGLKIPDEVPISGCECGLSDEQHTERAHWIEYNIGYEALSDFENAHDFEYTS